MKPVNKIPENYLFNKEALRKLIIPLFIEQFLMIFVGLVDSIMVSSVGEAAVSAVSLIDTIMVLLINIFTALATGGAIVAGQALGMKKKEQGCDAVEQTLLFSTAFSVFIMLAVYTGKWFILHVVFGKIEPDVMQNCNTYLMIVTASIPFMAIYNSGAAMFRAMGDSKTPMLMSLAMNSMNLVGNAILLYGLGWGIEGAALPTTLSRAFAGLWMLLLICNRNKVLHSRNLLTIRLKWPVLKRILHLGIPYALENSMFQLGKVLLLSLVSGFGTASIAANAVSNSVCSFAILGGMSMGYALSAITAQCVGAGDYTQVRYYTRKLLKYAYCSAPSCHHIRLSFITGNRKHGTSNYYLSCSFIYTDLGTLLYSPQHPACRQRCGILHVYFHRLHVDLPYRIQLYPGQICRMGRLRSMGCHDY